MRRALSDVVSDSAVGHSTAMPSAEELLRAARTRVYARLAVAADFPILLVHAPRGFGKTTVLQDFFAASGRRYRNLELEATHGDLLGFLRSFATGLADLAPALLASFMGVYDRMHRVDEAAKDIATWVAGHLEAIELTIVVDGLEKVTDERLFALLSELVDQTAHTRIRWALVGERADHFPVARWLANARMDLPLDDSDLALTYDDLLVAVERSGAAIGRATLRELSRSAGNWPAALALALCDVATLPTVSSEPPGVRPYAYFANRAFASRSETERRFLLETCLYKRFDLDLLARAGWHDVQPLLDGLVSAAAFITADQYGGYRYHEIIRSYLESRLRASPDQLFTRVATASADVCRGVGRWSDALELFIDLQASVPLAQLLSEHGFELVDRGEADLVYRGLATLSDADFAAFPVTLAVKASLESLHGSLDVAEAWFRHAIEHVGDPRQRGAIVFRFATDLVRQDRRDAIDVLQPIVAEGGHELALAVSLAGLLATAYATHGHDAQAAMTIERALQQLALVADPAVRAKLYFQAGYVAFFARDPSRAKNYAQQAVETALASHLYDIAARALSILYNVAMSYEDDARAGRLYLDQLASCSIKAGSRNLLVYARIGQFEIEVLRGNLEETTRLDEALGALEVDYSVFASETLLPAQALRATWSGDFHRAYRLIAPTAEKQITPVRQSQRYAEIALYAAAAGLHAEAGAAVQRTLAMTAQGDDGDKAVALTKAYAALALTLLGRHARAVQILSRLVRSRALTPRLEQLIEAIHIIHDRWSRGHYSSDLRDALKRLDACDLGGFGRLLEALPLPQTFRGQFAQLNVAEREVLIHMSEGLNSTEIAALSGQTVDAVDMLIVVLCRKLGCSSPRHAVALAQSMDGLRSAALEIR